MKYFLFDIGNVLVDFEFIKQLEGIAEQAVRPVERRTERDREMQAAVECGAINDEEFVAYLNDAKGISWTDADRKDYEDYDKRLKPMLERYDVLDINYFNPFTPDKTPEPRK